MITIQAIVPNTRAVPKDYIADMLRYDNGSIVSQEQLLGGRTKFTILVEEYTRGRWTSFGIATIRI